MTDDLDALRAALKAAPVPDPVAKAEALRLGMENFAKIHTALQGSVDPMRLPVDRPLRAGFLTKVRMMLKPLSSRPILTATTSAAALLLGVVLVLPLTKAPLPLALPKPQTTIITAAPVQKAESEALPAVPSPRAAPEAVMEKPMRVPSPTMPRRPRRSMRALLPKIR